MNNIQTEVDFIIESHQFDPRINKSGKRVRKRLNAEKAKYLNHEFQKNTNWSKAKQRKLGKRLGLPVSKIYKWSWDKKKSLGML